MSPEKETLTRQINELKRQLRIIAERKSEYISLTQIPLELVSDEERKSTQLRDLEAQLAALPETTIQEPTAALIELPEIPCPYRGLEAFEAKHAANYFGRDAMIAKLVDKVGLTNFVAVVGPSGSGKSSLVRAGLVTALTDQGRLPGSRQWEIAIIRPLDDPLRSFSQLFVDQLAGDLTPVKRIEEIRRLTDGLQAGRMPIGDVLAALRQKPGYPPRLVIIIDQFEETFTLTGDSDAAKAVRRIFLNTLLNASETPWLTIVFTLRADFYGHILVEERFGKRVDAGLVNVLPMTLEERRAAIEKPALAAGRRFEEGLVARILDDLEHEAGDLPLLEFALTELWERATLAGMLTHAAYEAIGEVAGAIAKRAEQTLRSLKPDEQQMVRRIFTRLVRVTQPEENAEDTKRRIVLSELDATYQPLVQKLADARLLVTGRDEQSGAETVEVAHEALLRNWQELQRWLNSDREFLLWRQRLRTRVAGWIASGKDKDDLLRGVQLNESEGWSSARRHDLSAQEHDFILTSRQQVDQEAKAEETRRQRELQLIEARAEAERQRAETQTQTATALRQRALWLAAALVAAILAAGVAYLYYTQATLAFTNEATARQAEASARQAAEAGSAALVVEVATRTAAEANAKQAAESESAQRTAAEQQSRLAQARYLANQAAFYRNTNPQLALLLAREAISSTYWEDGYTTVEANAALRGLLQPIYRPRHTWDHTSAVWSVAFSPNGKLLASGSNDDNSVILWEVSSGKPLASLRQHTEAVLSVAFSPDGTTLASGGEDNSIILWEVGSGKPLTTLRQHTDTVTSVAFSPDGKLLASGSYDGSVILWEVSSGKLLTTLKQHTGAIASVAFSPDGTTLASGSWDYSVILWEVSSGKLLTTLRQHTDTVRSVAFSPDGTTLASGSNDDSVILWEVSSGKLLTTLKQHTGAIASVAFSPDGTTLASGSWDYSVILWEVSSGKPLATLRQHTEAVLSVAFSPDGTTLASGGEDNSIILWEVGSGKPLTTLRQHTDTVTSVAFSPDGKLLASGSNDDSVILWEVSSGKLLTTLKQHTGAIASVAFSPDGKLLASGSYDGSVILWEVSSGKPLATLKQHTGAVTSVAFNPDGTTLASGSWDYSVILWEVSSGKLLATLRQHTDTVTSVAFSPDGKLLASGSWDYSVILWEVSSGKPLTTLKQHRGSVLSVAFSPDGKLFASGSYDDSVILWDKETKPDRIDLIGHRMGAVRAQFSAEGKRLLTADQGGMAMLWDITQGIRIRNIELHKPPNLDGVCQECVIEAIDFNMQKNRLLLANRGGTVQFWSTTGISATNTISAHPGLVDAKFSLDGNLIATASVNDSVVKVWNAENGQNLYELKTISGTSQLAFSPNGSQLASAGWDGFVWLWDLASGKEKGRLVTNGQALRSVLFNQRGDRLIAATFAGDIFVWHMPEAAPIAVLKTNHTAQIWQLAISPTGDRAATASEDHTVELWDLMKSRRIDNLRHDLEVLTIEFSSDGQQLASGSMDGTARLWDAATGRAIAVLPDLIGAQTLVSWKLDEETNTAYSASGSFPWIMDVTYNSQGDRLATTSADGTVTIYVVDNNQLLQIANAQITRDFTCQERVQFLSEQEDCAPAAQSSSSGNP